MAGDVKSTILLPWIIMGGIYPIAMVSVPAVQG
jgi:hypothetical protein